MTLMVIDARTLSPVFLDDALAPDSDPYAGCDWEPFCLTHGDWCEHEHADCVVPTTEHPRCDGTWSSR